MDRTLLLLMLLVQISCQKWQPTVDQLAELCGPGLQGASVMRFHEPDGDRLYTDEPYDFSVLFQSSAGAWRELAVNTYGCAAAPRESGTLVARSLGRNWAFARLHKGAEVASYEEVRLIEAQASAWELACPTGGWIAENHLANPLQFAGGPSEAFDVEVRARSGDKPWHVLSHKKIGLGLADAQQDFDLGELEAGVYELKLFVGFAGTEIPARPQGQCALEIVRHEPAFAEDAWRDGETLRLHEKRPVSPAVVGDRLMVCRSPGYMRELGERCEAGPSCQDLQNFVEADSFSVDEPGRWTYVYYLQHRAGRAGPLHCRRVFGSERAPSFDLRWQESRWNEAGHILSSLPASIEATFTSQGHSQELARPEPRFTCKIDFVHKGNIIVSEGVRCLSGLCEKQSLEEFVPCSSPLRLTAAQAFDSNLLLNSEMRLTVRADDGAGQITSQTKTLLLQDAQNFVWSTFKSLTNLGNDDRVSGFWYKPDGAMLVRVDTKGNARFFELSRLSLGAKSENWREAPNFLPAEQDLLRSEVSITEQGTALVSWNSRTRSDLRHRNDFARLNQGSWTPIVPKGWDPWDKRCLYILAEDDETFLCYNNYSLKQTQLLRLSLNKEPEVLPLPPLPNHCKTASAAAPITWIRNASKEIFAICRTEIAFRLSPGGNWESFPLPSGFSLGINTITFDEQDQPWFVMKNGKEAVLVAPTRFSRSIPLPSDLKSPGSTTRANETFGFDAKGQVRLGPYLWDQKNDNWMRDEGLIALLGTSAIQVRPVQGERGALFFETTRMTMFRSVGNQDRLFPLESMQWPPPYHDSFAYPFSMGVKLGPRGELCFSEKYEKFPHIRCVLRKNWAQLGNPATELNSIPDLNSFIADGAGNILAVAADGFYERQDSTWTKILPAAPEAAVDTFVEGNSLWVSAEDKIYRLKFSEKVWRLVSHTNESTGVLSRSPSRRVFSDSSGQVWIINRIRTVDKIGSRTLVKFTGDNRSLVPIPEDWEPLEIFPLEAEIIFLNEVTESGQKMLKIHAMDILTHEVRECDPATWGFDLSLFKGRDMSHLHSTAHEAAVAIYDYQDRRFEPIILDFGLKKQVSIGQLPETVDPFIPSIVRLPDSSYLIIMREKNPASAIVENYSFRQVKPTGEQNVLYDTNDLRAMEDRPGLRVTPLHDLRIFGAGPRMWIQASEGLSTSKKTDLFQFDLDALGGSMLWKSR